MHFNSNSSDVAAWLASGGWSLVPLHSPTASGCSCGRAPCSAVGKHPRTKNGNKAASSNLESIRAWWEQWPDANIGLLTGSLSKVVVLDVDPRNGGDATLSMLQSRHGPLPVTVASATGGGGQHLFFQHPGGTVKNSAGQVGPGLDIKGDGGLIVLPPSRHRSGRTYGWVAGRRPDQVPLAPVPPWLLTLAKAGSVREPLTRSRVGEWRHLAKHGVPEGARNASLASLAGALLPKIDPRVALTLLLAWNEARNEPPLPDDEVVRTVESIAKRELARRRGGSR